MSRKAKINIIDSIANDLIESVRDLTSIMEKMNDDMEELKETVTSIMSNKKE